MELLLVFAFLSGIITILSPCILPVLPVILAGSVGGGKARSFGIVLGFVFSFTVFTLTLTTIVHAFGIPADALRIAAVIIITLFGLILIIPGLHTWFTLIASGLANLGKKRKLKGDTASVHRKGGSELLAGLPVGVSLGLVWTPCAGPIMASVISLALTERLDTGAVLITLVYALGTALPMLAIMLGGRTLLNKVPVLLRNTGRIQKVFGVLMILVGVAIGLGWDRQFQAGILNLFPNYGLGLTALENAAPVRAALDQRRSLQAYNPEDTGTFRNTSPPGDGITGDFGKAPEIVTSGTWYNTADLKLNSSPGTASADNALTMQQLRGKVVLIDFWTYSCINCVRTIPYLKDWYTTYKKQGLVIIGVHTPEFEFEKKPENVAQAIEDLGITWPVVPDNEYKQWNAYSNRYWPAHYFIDAKGKVRYFSFGEGHYQETENVIRALLKEAGDDGLSKDSPVMSGDGGLPEDSLVMSDKINRDGDLSPGRESPALSGSREEKMETLTPETYLGYGRGRGFASAVSPVADAFADYRPSREPAESEWNLTGKWLIAREYIIPESEGTLELGFTARDVFLVVEPEASDGKIVVRVDADTGADTRDVKIGELIPEESRLYHLVSLHAPGTHLLTLQVKGKLRLFAFTFG